MQDTISINSDPYTQARAMVSQIDEDSESSISGGVHLRHRHHRNQGGGGGSRRRTGDSESMGESTRGSSFESPVDSRQESPRVSHARSSRRSLSPRKMSRLTLPPSVYSETKANMNGDGIKVWSKLSDCDPEGKGEEKGKKRLSSTWRELSYMDSARRDLISYGIDAGQPERLADGRIIIACPSLRTMPSRELFPWMKQCRVERGVITITLHPWNRPLWYRTAKKITAVTFWMSVMYFLFAVGWVVYTEQNYMYQAMYMVLFVFLLVNFCGFRF